MSQLRTLATAAVAIAAASLWLVPGVAGSREPGLGPDLDPAGDATWREVLERAVAATGMSYEAEMVVVSLGEDGPGVTELRLSRDMTEGVTVASTESWLIAHDGTHAMYRDEPAGRLVQLGEVASLPFTLPEVGRHYDVTVDGRARLLTGTAVAVAFRRDGALRERLFVDDETGQVVRRETYDREGTPVRVTALTELRITDVDMTAMDDADEPAMQRTRVAPHEVAAMAGHGWEVPTTVGEGFDLRAGFVLEDRDAVQLVYSDGLYTLSLLEQPGRVDPGALDGAVATERDGIPVYRWPGAEPERMVWNGDGHTFTAVTDAPSDVLMTAVADLPHDTAPSMPSRIGRGFARLGHWLWPFD